QAYSTRPAQPRRMPTTRYPSRSARIVIARIAGFKPGTSPPPVRIAIAPFRVAMRCRLEDRPYRSRHPGITVKVSKDALIDGITADAAIKDLPAMICGDSRCNQ